MPMVHAVTGGHVLATRVQEDLISATYGDSWERTTGCHICQPKARLIVLAKQKEEMDR